MKLTNKITLYNIITNKFYCTNILTNNILMYKYLNFII